MSSNQDQYNEKNAQLIAAFEDLLKQSFAALNLNGAGVGAAAGANSLDQIAVGDAAAVRNAIGFAAAALVEMQKMGIGQTISTPTWPKTSINANPSDIPSGLYRIHTSNTDLPTGMGAGFATWNVYDIDTKCLVVYAFFNGKFTTFARYWYRGAWQPWITNRDSSNTSVDSNGFIKSASPIFRLANNSRDAMGDGFTLDGCGAYNNEAAGVTATHDETGVYTVSGSLGFAIEGWTITLPQDPNTAQTMVMVETEQADDGTITVRVYSRRFDINTASIVAGDPMDIPNGRWIDLRLSMPAREPAVVDEPDAIDELPAEE